MASRVEQAVRLALQRNDLERLENKSVNSLRELIAGNAPVWLAVGGLLIGAMFGFVVARTNFCAMGAISDIVVFADHRRFRAWLLAGAVAIAGAQILDAGGVVALSQSMYPSASLNWLGNSLGGLMFGYGMVFAGGCASRNLTRVGGGDLRALLTLMVMALFAYMTMGGLLGPLRDVAERTTAIGLGSYGLKAQDLGSLLAAELPGHPVVINLGIAFAIAAGMLAYCLEDRGFRGSPVHILSGIGVGLCVVAGWALTGLAFDDMAARPAVPASLTFVRPTADAIEWLQRFTAGMIPGFGAASVLGVVLGSFIAATALGQFRWTTFADLADTRRNLYGATLMGIGGVLAQGCTIGQAVTGISTLALGSFLTFAAIVAGGVLAMKRMERILALEL